MVDNRERKAYYKAYRLAHKKELAAKRKAYYLAHKKKIDARNKVYHLAHKKERKAYRLAHKERIAANRNASRLATRKKEEAYRLAHKKEAKAYQLAHKKEMADWQKGHYLKYPEKRKAFRRKRRALKRGVKHEDYATNYIFKRDGWICQLCGQRINRRLKYPNPHSKSIDHIVPLSRGGNDSPSNVQATHLRCNLGKNATNKGQLRLFG